MTPAAAAGVQSLPVDLGALESWMDERGIGAGPLADAEPISGGTQNVLVRFRRGDRHYVLRRPPVHKRPDSDDTMRREARILTALRHTSVPHPRVVAACSEVAPLGAAFYLMDVIDGFCPLVELPAPFDGDAALQRAMGFAVVDAIGALATVDLDAVGLGDLGRREGWVDRQADRWWGQLESYGPLGPDAGVDLPGARSVAAWLRANRPPSSWTGLVHGDVHFGNVLVDRARPRLAALVDWELATVGDPLLDLGHLLATWPRRGPTALTARPKAPGLPAPAELVERYVDATGRTMGDLPWFHALACFRLAVIIEGSHARGLAGRAPAAMGEGAHRGALALLAQAEEVTM